MKTIIVLISLLFSLPAAGYEVIFHEGFEGEQFPPEGWDSWMFNRVAPGHDSEWCARCGPATSEDWAGLESPPITLIPNNIYVIRLYDKGMFFGEATVATAKFYFNDDTFVLIVHHWGGFDNWRKEEVVVETPEDVIYGYFKLRAWTEETGVPVDWYVDDFMVIHSATTVVPASFGRIKAAYR